MNDQELIDLKQDVEDLKQRRVHQSSIPPATIKQRHMGQGPMFIRAGLEANLPTSGDKTDSNSTAIYFCTDTFKLKIWNGLVWKSVTLS